MMTKKDKKGETPMFEREVVIATLKRENEMLGQLIEEIEEKPKHDSHETQCCRKYHASPMRMREIS